MKKQLTLALAVAALAAAPLWAVEHAHWGYTGEAGPQHWAQLDPAYATCGKGRHQSPVNLRGFADGHLKPIRFQYAAGGHEVINNGHTVQVNYTIGSDIRVAGQRYELRQFHFHSPSENHIEGKSYPLEADFLHSDGKGHLAVVAVMFKLGAENRALDEVWNVLPMHSGEAHLMHRTVLAADLLPRDKSYYRYEGSLTMPPCSEGVSWLVMKQPLEFSQAQLDTFHRAIGGSDNRPLQALNGRRVLE